VFKSFASRRAFALAVGIALAASTVPILSTPVLAAKRAAGATKAAKQPIAVGQVTGPQGPKVRARVLKVLKASGLYEVTDAEDLKPTDKPATFARSASMLQVDAVIVGTVTKKMTLLVTAYGANGSKIDTIEVPGGSFPKLFAAIDNELEIAIADPLANAKQEKGGKAAAAPAAAAADDDSDIEISEGTAAEEEKPKAEKPKEEKPKEEKPKEEKPKAAAAAAGTSKAKKGKAEEEPVAEDEDEESALEEEEEASSDEEGEEDDEGEEAAASEPGEKGRRPLEATAGVRGYNRKFNYTSTTDPRLHSYSLDIAPAIIVSARVYPGAWFRNDILSHLGLSFRYELGIPTTTQYPLSTGAIAELKTKAGEWQFGARGRFPIGPHELGTSLAYGQQWFKLKGDEAYGVEPYAVVPDVDYHYVRVSVDARFYIKKLIVGGHFAPRFVTSLDELDLEGVWFPAATGSGLDFGVMGGWQLMPILAVVGGLDVARYGFDFNPVPVDNRVVAGGATDTYLSLWVGAMFTFDAQANASGASVEASTD
jgi:hypothetical protein